MARNLLVINCDLRETRVALIEDGVIAELQIERASARSTVGNVVLGRVSRVLPGMQAAFIEVGMERAAFLHVEDLIRPDDFEAYLRGNAREHDADPSMRGEGGRRHNWGVTPTEGDESAEAGDEAQVEQTAPAGEETAEEGAAPSRRGRRRRGGRRRGRRRGRDEATAGDGSESEVPTEAAADGEGKAPTEAAAGGEGETTGSAEPAPDDETIEVAADDSEDDEAIEVAADDSEDDEAIEVAADDSEDDEEAIEVAADDSEDDEAIEVAADDSEAIEETVEEEADDDSVAARAGSADSEVDSAWDDDSEPEAAADGKDAAEATAGDESEQRAADAAEAEPGSADEAADDAGTRRRVSARAPKADDEQEDEEPRGRGRRRRRRRRRPKGEGEAESNGSAAAAAEPASGKSGKRGEERARGNGKDKRKNAKSGTSRVSRSVPITEVVKEGDEVIVQISKEPIGTKGARVTSHVSLPGRYVVYMPTVEHIGISKRIGSANERGRLRKVMEALKPQTGGLIVRTVAEGLTKKGLKADVGYLIKLWADVASKREGAKAPTILYSELDLVLKTARDLFTDDIEKIVIDDKDQYARLVRFIEMFLPERVKDIELYSGDEPMFDAYGIEDEIGRALSRKVPLPSGGYLIIDQAEALTAIDVNTGRYVGKGSKDLEETALKTNLEAVDEIAYQLRFRNIGGLVILDLIDMEIAGNREKVWRALLQKLNKDKAKTTLNRISELGLIEMTRKRTRESLSRVMHEPCFYCDGTGQIQSRTTIAYEILRQIRRERHTLAGYVVLVNAHPAIVDLMNGEEKEAVTEAERRYMRRIELVPRREYHIEQFDLQGK